MKIIEYVKQTDFESSGLPQGDTFIDLEKTEIAEGKNEEGKKTYKLIFPDGKNYRVPKTVMAEIQDIVKAGATKVRVTRTGKTQVDTKYTVVKQ